MLKRNHKSVIKLTDNTSEYEFPLYFETIESCAATRVLILNTIADYNASIKNYIYKEQFIQYGNEYTNKGGKRHSNTSNKQIKYMLQYKIGLNSSDKKYILVPFVFREEEDMLCLNCYFQKSCSWLKETTFYRKVNNAWEVYTINPTEIINKYHLT